MIDGIDGSGKSTIVEAWKEYIVSQGNPIFDLKKYWKDLGKHPDISELKSYDFVFSSEPTNVGIGAVIRNELIQEGNTYPMQAVAEAFSLDRLILYTKIHIPLLESQKCVIQDRGISTSLAYQSLKEHGLGVDGVLNLIGNKLAMKHRPDVLVLVDISPETAMARLNQRSDKNDNSIFEKLDYLKKLSAQFSSTEYSDIFEKCGTKIMHLNGEEKIDIMKEQSINLLKQILK